MVFFQSKSDKSPPKPPIETTPDTRITALEARCRKLESETLDLMTALESIRNKVLRKIQEKNQPEKVEVTFKAGQPVPPEMWK
jgi:hypothetical protein